MVSGGEDVAPALVGEGGAEKARGVVQREAEECLTEDVVRELARRWRHG
jgi:hypothetical protein